MAVNGYIDENGVFVNKFGITDPETLHEVEYQITARQARDWAERKPHTDIGFGLTRLQTIHAHLMGEIYAWAGKIRTVPSRKRGSFASVTEFANPNGANTKI